MRAGSQIFNGQIDPATSRSLASLAVGSDLRLTGICQIAAAERTMLKIVSVAGSLTTGYYSAWERPVADPLTDVMDSGAVGNRSSGGARLGNDAAAARALRKPRASHTKPEACRGFKYRSAGETGGSGGHATQKQFLAK